MHKFLITLIIIGGILLVTLLVVHSSRTVQTSSLPSQSTPSRTKTIDENRDTLKNIEIRKEILREEKIEITKEPIKGGNVVENPPQADQQIEVKPPEGGWDYEK